MPTFPVTVLCQMHDPLQQTFLGIQVHLNCARPANPVAGRTCNLLQQLHHVAGPHWSTQANGLTTLRFDTQISLRPAEETLIILTLKSDPD